MLFQKLVLFSIFFVLPVLAGLEAKPIFARQYKQQYGYMPSCTACHSEGGGSPINNYGKAFKDNGSNIAAFAKIATLDSDGDGAKKRSRSKSKSKSRR